MRKPALRIAYAVILLALVSVFALALSSCVIGNGIVPLITPEPTGNAPTAEPEPTEAFDGDFTPEPTATPAPASYGYDEFKFNALSAFLEQTDENGLKNGKALSSSYKKDDPSTWGGEIGRAHV